MQKPVATNQIRKEVMIHGTERILGWRLAASAFLQVVGFLWALGPSQNQTGMVLYRTPRPPPPVPLTYHKLRLESKELGGF